MSAPLQLMQRGVCRARVRSLAAAPCSRALATIATARARPALANGCLSPSNGDHPRPSTPAIVLHSRSRVSVRHKKLVEDSSAKPQGKDYADILPTELLQRLQEAYPHVQQPTQTQRDFMRAIWDDQDVFLKDRTGSGKTFALVLAILSRCLTAPPNTPSPSHLILLPNPTLVQQVAHWIASLQQQDQAPLALALSADKSIEAGTPIPPILLTTPNLLLPHLDSPDSPLSADVLVDSLQMVAVDEVDSLLRPIPGRYTPATAAQHPFYLHPPAAVRALRPLLDVDAPWRKGRKGGRPHIQTVWMSASLNVPVKNWIFHQGWLRRGPRQMISLDGTAAEGEVAFAAPKERMIGDVKHHLITVDVLTGKLSDATQSTSKESVPLPPVQGDEARRPGQIDPLIVEALASLWASSNSAVSIVVPPEGSSTPKLLESLAALGVQAVVHGDQPPADAGNVLYVVSRSQVRGLDLPTLDTVYILGGLDATQMSKNTRQHGGMAEKEKEYRHILGRVGRMGRQGGEQKVVCLVMRNSPEHQAFAKYVAASEGKVVLDPWKGELL